MILLILLIVTAEVAFLWGLFMWRLLFTCWHLFTPRARREVKA